MAPPPSNNNNYLLQRVLFTALLISLQTPSVFTWTTQLRDVASLISSSRTTQHPKQRIVAALDDIISQRNDGLLTILQASSIDDHDGGDDERISLQPQQRRWNRLRWRRRKREDATQLFASNSDNNDDDIVNDDNEATNSNNDAPANKVNEFVQKAQQAWTSSPPPPSSKISMNKLNKMGARESLLNSVSKGTTGGSGSSSSPSSIGSATGQEDSGNSVGNVGMLSPPLKGASTTTNTNGGIPPLGKGIPSSSSSPFTPGIPSKGIPKKMMTTKSYGKGASKWKSTNGGTASNSSSSSAPVMKSFSDGILPPKSNTDDIDNDSIGIKTPPLPPPPIMKGAISKGTIQSPQQQQQQQQPPSSVKAVKSPSDFLKEFAKNNAPKFMPKVKEGVDSITNGSISGSNSGSSSSVVDTNNNSNDNDDNNSNDSENTNNTEEAKYLTVAKEAYSKFFSNQLSQEEYMTMALDAWRDNVSSLFLGRSKSTNGGGDSDDSNDGLVKGESSGVDEKIEEEEEEEEVPSSKSILPPPIQKSPVVKSGGNGDSLKNYINSIKKSRSFGEKLTTPPPPMMKKGDASLQMKSLGGEKKKQITLPPLPLMKKKGAVAPLNKSSGEKKQITPTSSSSSLPQMKKGIAPPKQLDSTVKKNWQGNRGGLSFLKSDKLSKEYKAYKNYNPMNKAVTVEKIQGVMKGKETSISSGNKLSSTPPLLDKGGVKLGIQGKFAPKKLDITAKKDWQGNRGGLSFLKSDKLSKEYKAEKNYNPMNKAVSVEKIQMLKISQAGKAKSDDDVEASLEDNVEEPEDDEGELEDTTLEPTRAENKNVGDDASASRIERWNKESLPPTLKGSESTSTADTNVDEESELPEGKTATISITDQGGTDVVNPGRAFIPAPKVTEKKSGLGGGGAKFAIKFASTKLGLKGGIPSKGGVGSPLSGSAKLLAKKSGLLKGSTGAKQFSSTGAGGFLNKQKSRKLDFSLLKKGGISSGSKVPFQKSGDVPSNVKSAPTAMGSKVINGLGANDTSKSPLPGATADANPPLSFKKSSTPKLSTPPKTIQTADSGAKSSTSATKLITDGVNAEEAERIRLSRLQTDVNSEGKVDDVPATIKEGMTAEEAERARKARIDIPASGKQIVNGKGVGVGVKKESPPLPHFASKSLGGDGGFAMKKKGFPSAPLPVKGPMAAATSNDVGESKGLPLKGGGMSMGEKQAGLPGKGMPFMKKAPSFSMEKKSLPPLPLKGKGDDAAGLKKGLPLPPLAKKSLGGDGGFAMKKKGFPSAPLPVKGPMSTATDEEATDDVSAPKGLPLKGGGMSMGEKQAGLPGKGMPFMKKAPSFSMEKKSLPPLPLKGKGDDAGGLKKGLPLPPLPKKSLGGDGGFAMKKKGFPSAPLPVKGPMSTAADEEATDDVSAPKGLPLKGGGMSMGEKQAGLPGKGMPFMKKAPSFSMEKKSLPPLPLKGKGDDAAGLKKGLPLPPLAKKSLGGDGGFAMKKKGFPSAPLPVKGPMSTATDEEATDDVSAPKGLPLKGGGMSMGEKQAGLPGKGMPFMKKAPSFSMEKKSLPPLPLKGKGDDAAGLKKGLPLPPLPKKSLGGDGGFAMKKKGFPSAPLPVKGPMSTAADEEATDDVSAPKGLPLKGGGMSMGEKQAGLPGKGMPFMKKAPSFSMEKKSLPPLPLKGKGDDAAGLKKGLPLPPLPKKSLGGDGGFAMKKKGFPSAPLPVKGPMSTATDEEATDDVSAPKGLPLKGGGMSMGEKQAGLPGKGMPFMKKAPSFSMEKKSLPPLPLKGKGDDAAGLKKGLPLPPLPKKSLGGDGGFAMKKKGFPSAPLPVKGPMSTAADEEATDDVSAPKGLPLKGGGMSMGEKQAGLPGKGMPFMKKAPSFSMEKKSLPPLPLKGKGDDAGGLKKGLPLPPLPKKSLGGDGGFAMKKKGFPSAPLPVKGPMSTAADEEATDDVSAPKGLPLKGGGMSMGEKQAGLPGKGMPFMKKAPSFSMEKKSLPPLPLKGKGDDAAGLKKGLPLPPLPKKSLGGDGGFAMKKKGFPSAPLPVKGPMSTATDEEATDDVSAPKGLPLKGGGMSMGEKQAGLPGKGMPFMKKAPSFSMEKKSLPPLPLKGKGDDAAGLKKGLPLPPLPKKSLGGDGGFAMKKKGFPSAPLPVKGPMSTAADEEATDDVSAPKGLPLKGGGMSMGEKQAGLPGKGMPFMKKAPSFSMEKKSLPPLPLKGKGDDAAGLKKGLPLPPLPKKSLGGDGGFAMKKKGFPSAPLPVKGPMSTATDEEATDDVSAPKGLPLKGGGMSMGEKQAGLPGKGMPFMKKAPSFSMEKKSLPPLPLKGKGDDAGGLKKGLPLPPLAKKSLGGDGGFAMKKKGFPSAPLPVKGPMSTAADEEATDDVSAPKGLPLKGGGMSMGEKQAGLPGKGMPFMKKAPSFSMEKKSLPPLPLKGKGDDAGGLKKGLPLPPLAKKSLGGDGGFAMKKKGFPSAPLPVSNSSSDSPKDLSPNEEVSGLSSDDEFTEDFASSGSSVTSWSSTPDKELGKGAAFLPKFAPPPMRGEGKDPNDFSWLESAEAIDIDVASSGDEGDSNDDAQIKEARRQAPSKGPVKLWGGESFLGTSSSRVYGLGSQQQKSGGMKGNDVSRGRPSSDSAVATTKDAETWGSRDDAANAARLMDEMNESNDSIDAVEKRIMDEKKESMIAEEQRLIEEKTKIAALLYDTEKRLSIQLEKFKEEKEILKDDRARAEAERVDAENRIQEIEAARIRAEREAERLEQRFNEEKSALSSKLSDAERARTDDEKRLVEEKAKVAALISEAEKKLSAQLEKFEEERLQMNKEKETAAAERSKAQRQVEEADAARIKAEEDAKMLEALLSEQKSNQEKWMEEQKAIAEETLEKRIAEEKSKIDAALADAKAKEEARLVEEQKRQVEAQLEQRLAEEKSKLDAEIAAAEEKIRRELELLESEKSANIVEAVKEQALNENEEVDISPPAIAPPLEEELALPDQALGSMQDLPKLTTTSSDVLTADVEALELISMCNADFDSSYSTDVSSSEESCLLPTDYPFVSLLRDSSPYIVNHRHSTIVYHIPGDLINDVEKFNSVMDDIALTWLFGMKIVLCVGCRTQVSERLAKLEGKPTNSKSGVRVTTDTALRILEEEAGFCRFEVERQLNRCLRSKGANCNVVSGCFITAKKYGVVDGVDYQHTGYPKTLQTDRINRFVSRNDVVLLTPLGFTEDGQALNIKSEQLAGFTAGALKASKVVYFSTKPLVMRGSSNSGDANANQRIQMIQRSNALQILSHHGLKIHSKTGFPHWRHPTTAAKNPKVQSYLLKMGWATDALDKGVERAHIIACDDGALLEELFTARRGYGTCISQDDYEAPHPEDQNDDLLADDVVSAGVIGRGIEN